MAAFALCFVLLSCSQGGSSPQPVSPPPVVSPPVSPPPGQSTTVVPQPPPTVPGPTNPDPEPQLPSLVESPPQGLTDGEIDDFYHDTYLGLSGSAVELRIVNLPGAYRNIYKARGESEAARPGKGVTIGFVDSGLDTEHPSFREDDGKAVEVEYFGTSKDADIGNLVSSHGTAVASIAAGARSWCLNDVTNCTLNNEGGLSLEGIAPGANIFMFAFNVDSPNWVHNAGRAIAAAFERNVDILNLSFSEAEGIVTDARFTGNTDQFLGLVGRQTDREEKTIFVWSAGNLNGSVCTSPAISSSCVDGRIRATSPNVLAGLPYHVPELKPFWVAVVSTDLNPGEISSFSNRCGVAKEWCIAAPGERIGVAVTSMEGERRISSIGLRNGTSFSAPIVSGGLALMKQVFRGQISNVELVQRMFATANKDGIYFDTEIYGQGLLDLEKATNPVGTAGFASVGTQFLDAEGTLFSPLYAAQMETSQAFGDGLEKFLAQQEVAAFDSLGAPFWYPLEKFFSREEVPFLQRQLSDFIDFTASGKSRAGPPLPRGSRVSAPLFRGKVAKGLEEEQMPEIYISTTRSGIEDPNRLGKSGHLSFIDNPLFAGVDSGNFDVFAFTSGERVERHGRGVVASFRLPNLPLGFRSGYISESRSALGATAEGLFGGFSAQTVFASIGWEYGFGGWRLVAEAEAGAVYPEAETGFVGGLSQLSTSSFSAGLIREFPDGLTMKFSVSSPLRVESGHMEFVIPVGRTLKGEILRDKATANLEPSGRQVDIGAQVVVQTLLGRVSLGGVVSHEPGHDKDAEVSLSFLAGYSANF